MSLNDDKGFTIIELLIVILIIGVLAATAIPMMLGQRERARYRAMEVTSKSVEKEMKIIIGDFSKLRPIVFIDASGQQSCYEKAGISRPYRCAVVYSTVPWSGTYDSLVDVISLFIVQQNIGLVAKSPFIDAPLLTNDNTSGNRNSHVVLVNTSDKDVMINSWSPDGGLIYNTSISAR